MLTIAYLGNGKSTNRYHLPFSRKLTDKINIKKIFSPSKPVWETFEDIEYTDQLSDLWNDPEIQLVVITTPSQFHYEYGKMALEHGKNVLVEKPFAETSKEAEELFALAKVIESGKLGDILEVEMHYDYFRPEVPENTHEFSTANSYLYGHACHTVDQVLSYFGEPDDIRYDVRQLLGKGRMNDYFDLDFFYGNMKISIKSSYFRIKERPSFVVYGKKGMFVKQTKDRQEEHLKMFYMPDHEDFGIDLPEHYGVLTYIDEQGDYHEEKVISEVGDYSRVYEGIYETLVNGAEKVIKDEETILQMKILEEGIKGIQESENKR